VADRSVSLKALTPEAKAALHGVYLKITHFPFRVGRESRTFDLPIDYPNNRRRPDSASNNDLYLFEPGNILNVSREHFLIDAKDDKYVLVDRGSFCGTLVEGELVGEKRKGGWRELADNDVIIVGTSESTFIFKFLIAANS
jgi:pSer/pThr/pTyr-binding forkhead associated (FHA) protein